jgi:hypothetical protein
VSLESADARIQCGGIHVGVRSGDPVWETKAPPYFFPSSGDTSRRSDTGVDHIRDLGSTAMAKGQVTRRQKDISRLLREKKRVLPPDKVNRGRKDRKKK